MKNVPGTVDVVIIGAGPSGAIASALLLKQGHSVVVLEKARFPRFSIGESLLPQCMEFLEEAGMLEAVKNHGFQFKNGASFSYLDKRTVFDFSCQYTAGWSDTYQVRRADFDKVLADRAEALGVPIFYEHEIIGVDLEPEIKQIRFRPAGGEEGVIAARFVLDASGFGRVLPRLLNLEKPSDFPVRKAVFTHVMDNIEDTEYDRNKILICVHPVHRDIWYWLIPFPDGVASLGVVGAPKYIDGVANESMEKIRTLVNEEHNLGKLLENAEYSAPASEIVGYAANVDSLYGPGFALLGNAGEFLDPVFSSGVTIAMKSASLAAGVLDRQLKGRAVDWENEYEKILRTGVNTFKAFVSAWYDGSFQDIIFSVNQNLPVKQKICSILAGYAWDTTNPYVSESKRRLGVLSELCR